MADGFAHPFPPVVRWVILPGLLSLAGALGGAGASAFTDRDSLIPLMLMGGTAGGVCALTLAISVQPILTIVGAPIVGLFLVISVLGASGQGSPGRVLEQLFREPQIPLILSVQLEGLLLPALLYLRRPPGRWGGPLLLYLAGGVVWTTMLLAFENVGSERTSLLVFGMLVAGAQLPALAAIRAVASRLRRADELI